MSSNNKKKRSVTTGKVKETPIIKQTATSSSRYASSAEFNPDYTYVIKDLKKIGSLAGFFIVILVILSFFLK